MVGQCAGLMKIRRFVRKDRVGLHLPAGGDVSVSSVVSMPRKRGFWLAECPWVQQPHRSSLDPGLREMERPPLALQH